LKKKGSRRDEKKITKLSRKVCGGVSKGGGKGQILAKKLEGRKTRRALVKGEMREQRREEGKRNTAIGGQLKP